MIHGMALPATAMHKLEDSCLAANKKEKHVMVKATSDIMPVYHHNFDLQYSQLHT